MGYFLFQKCVCVFPKYGFLPLTVEGLLEIQQVELTPTWPFGAEKTRPEFLHLVKTSVVLWGQRRTTPVGGLLEIDLSLTHLTLLSLAVGITLHL